MTSASVAIDGSKFKAVNGRDKNFTVGKMKRRRGEVDKSIARYLTQLESADRQETAGGVPVPAAKVKLLKEKVEILHREIEHLNALEEELLADEDQQISLLIPMRVQWRPVVATPALSATTCRPPPTPNII